MTTATPPFPGPSLPGMFEDLPGGARAVASALRRFRRARDMKQAHLAELLSIDQTTLSRWERGSLVPSARRRVRIGRLLGTAGLSPADRALWRLVETSPFPMHLVCDLTHRLLAASPARRAYWHVDYAQLLGISLFPYASRAIAALESDLADLGWGETPGRAIVAHTERRDGPLHIPESHYLIEGVLLADGCPARLVTTVVPGVLESLHRHADVVWYADA